MNRLQPPANRFATRRPAIRALAIAVALLAAGLAHAADAPLEPSRTAAKVDRLIDWSAARLIAVQHEARNKTLDSFARETMSVMVGKEHLPGLSPTASLLEWIFRNGEYADQPVIYVREKGLRVDFSRHMPKEKRDYIVQTGYFTPRQFADPTVRRKMEEFAPRFDMGSAMGRVGGAREVAFDLERMLLIVPPGVGDQTSPWFHPNDLLANLPGAVAQPVGAKAPPPVPGVNPDEATAVLGAWAKLQRAWIAGDALAIQENLDRLALLLPAMAGPGVYPVAWQRSAEATYYGMHKFVWGWIAYVIGAFVAVLALVTRWRAAAVVSQILLCTGLAVHIFGVALRWLILGRIPVANMYEALIGASIFAIGVLLGIELTDRFRRTNRAANIGLGLTYSLLALVAGGWATYAVWFTGGGRRATASDWLMVGFTFLLLSGATYLAVSSLLSAPRLVYRACVHPAFLLAGNAGGFLALVLAGYVVPGGGALTSIMSILDDVMLRIHTVLIIMSYALIFIASVIALAYLFCYYMIRAPRASLEAGLSACTAGVALWIASYMLFATVAGFPDPLKAPGVALVGSGLAGGLALLLALLAWVRAGHWLMAPGAIGMIAAVTMAIGNQKFVLGMGMVLAIGGLVWALGNIPALIMGRAALAAPGLALAGAGGRGFPVATGGGGGGPPSAIQLRRSKPLLAGDMPGDEARARELPGWLHEMDWVHLIILNIVFVVLFVGIILGAVWADYSWGRPWGWDPKEVFAMNTWIIYAILIHTRFIVKSRGLWTAWMSVAGCLMMAFNWCFVNFFIVGLHSYA